MMAATSDTSEINAEHKDSENKSNATSPAVNHEVKKATDLESSGSNVVAVVDEPTNSSAHQKPKDSTDLNQEEANASNTPPDPNASEGEDQVSASIPDKRTGDLHKDVPSVNPHDVETKSTVATVSGHQNPEETGKTSTSTDGEDLEKVDDPTASHGHGKKSEKKTPANQTKPDSEPFETSHISSIRYEPNEPDLLEDVLDNATDKKLINLLLGCAYGQALGDAYGLSTEFEDRHDVVRNYPNCSLIPFPDYVLTGHNRRWARGDWTDDTDQWILIFITLMFHNGDERVFAEKLTNWIYYGYPELGDHGGMGLGANVSQVVRSPNYINDPLRASKNVWERGNRQAAPNGAVMRCSGSAFVHFRDPQKVIATTELMCKTTHFDPRCIASCLAVCLAVTYLLIEEINDDKIEELISRVQQETIDIIGNRFTQEDIETFKWYTDKRTPEELNLDEQGKIGYTYKCLASGFYGLRSTDSFQQTLHDLIRYGGDADTNGAVCGTLYGARHGYRKLPYEWLKQMPNKKWLDQILIKCLTKMNLIEDKAMETD